MIERWLCGWAVLVNGKLEGLYAKYIESRDCAMYVTGKPFPTNPGDRVRVYPVL